MTSQLRLPTVVVFVKWTGRWVCSCEWFRFQAIIGLFLKLAIGIWIAARLYRPMIVKHHAQHWSECRDRTRKEMSIDCDMAVFDGVLTTWHVGVREFDMRSNEINHWAESFHAHGPLSPAAIAAGALTLNTPYWCLWSFSYLTITVASSNSLTVIAKVSEVFWIHGGSGLGALHRLCGSFQHGIEIHILLLGLQWHTGVRINTAIIQY